MFGDHHHFCGLQVDLASEFWWFQNKFSSVVLFIEDILMKTIALYIKSSLLAFLDLIFVFVPLVSKCVNEVTFIHAALFSDTHSCIYFDTAHCQNECHFLKLISYSDWTFYALLIN